MKEPEAQDHNQNPAHRALLQKLLDDPELRQRFLADPQTTLKELGLNGQIDLASFRQEALELEGADQFQNLETRRSKSAWFGGNPFA